MKKMIQFLRMSFLFRHLCKMKLEIQKGKSKRMLWYRQLMDCMLGIASYFIIKRTVYGFDAGEHFTEYVLLLKEELTILLKWLMGAPVGLKLNEELSFFLGNVFLYHVNVWVAYVLAIKIILPQLVHFLIMSNFFGVTIFLSLVNDVINVLSVHLHCFYFYASNLYRIQLKSLMTLARLFRGKKWNVLRLRVDSLSYKADQLILGTVLFTILLFLLPTVALYYLVFMFIRITILLVQTFFQWMANSLLNTIQSLLCSTEERFDDAKDNDITKPNSMVNKVQVLLGKITRGEII